MAKLIKETPILRGRDAKRFKKELKKSEIKKVSPDVRERMNRNFDMMKNIVSF